MKKSQAGLEYLMLTAVVLTILTGILVIASKEIAVNTSATQAEEFVATVAGAVDQVYSQGEGSKKFLNLRMPNSVKTVNISNNEVLIKLSDRSGVHDIYKLTKANMTGEIAATRGYSRIIVEMRNDSNVWVNTT